MSAPYQLFPELAPDDFEALKRDIADRGVMVAVEYDEDGNVLDGHHRLRAYEELGREGITLPPPPSIVREGMTEREKREHVRRLNILRRHLTQEQKRELIREQVKETPERSNRQIGSALGVDHKTVAAQRSELESTGEIPQSTERQGADGRVINTANIGRTPASSPVSSAEDDYVPEPEYGYDEPIADSEGVEHVTYPMAMPSPEPQTDEQEPISLPSTQAMRDAYLRADFLKCVTKVSQIVAYAPDRVVAVLPPDDADAAERTLSRLVDWLAQFKGGRVRPMRVIGE